MARLANEGGGKILFVTCLVRDAREIRGGFGFGGGRGG